MIKTLSAFAALALAAAASAQTAGPLPKCSATVHDSCDQGADNPSAMTAEQAMATGGVGDRGHDDAAHMGAAKPMMHKKKVVHHTMAKKAAAGTTTTDTTTTTTKPQ